MDHCVLGVGWAHEPKFGAVAENSRPLLCDCQAGWLPWCANLDMLARTQTLTDVRTHISTHTHRSAGSACGQHCIVAGLHLSWTFNSAGIQLFLVTQDQRAASNNTCLHTTTLLCPRGLKRKDAKTEYFVKKKKKERKKK